MDTVFNLLFLSEEKCIQQYWNIQNTYDTENRSFQHVVDSILKFVTFHLENMIETPVYVI